jgi:hypothetical protein
MITKRKHVKDEKASTRNRYGKREKKRISFGRG